MWRVLLAFAALGCIGILSLSQAKELSPEPYIQQLGSNRFTVRENASTALENLGEQALPALQSARKDADAETRQRIDTIVERIQKNRIFTPRPITLSHASATLQEIVQDLSRQSGYPLRLTGFADHRLQVHANKVSFWQALDQVMLAGGLALDTQDPREFKLIPYDVWSPYRYHAGPFRVTPLEFRSQKQLPLHQLPRTPVLSGSNNDLTLNLEILVEPRLILLSAGEAKIEVAVDEQGRSLLPIPDVTRPRFQGVAEPVPSREIRKLLAIPLNSPDRKSERVAHLKGTIPLKLLIESAPEREIASICTKRDYCEQFNDIECQIDEVQQVGQRWRVDLRYRAKNQKQELDPLWVAEAGQRMELVDADGMVMRLDGEPSILNLTPDMVQIRWEYQGIHPQAKPEKLRWMQWKTWTHLLEFEFKDLPLP